MPIRLEAVLKDATLAGKALTLKQADLVATKSDITTSREFFHDLSAVSVGLLTNTATGSWRKDLSLLTEKWDSQATANLPLFRLTPTTDVKFTRPAPGNAMPDASMFYPWAGYRGDNSTPPIYAHGAVTSWANLVDFATFYKRVTTSASGRLSTPTYSVAIFGDSFNFIHKVRILPVIARMQWVFSHSAGAVTDPSKLEPRVLLTPVITMWNPYNVEITAQPLSFSVMAPLPIALKYSINGSANSTYNSVMGGSLLSNNNPPLGSGSLSCQIATPLTLKPGETRLFSPSDVAPFDKPMDSSATLTLKSGYRSGGGHYFPVKDNSGNTLALPPSSTIKADAKFSTTHYNLTASGVGIYLDMSDGGSWDLAYRMVYTPEIANLIYKPMTQLAEGNRQLSNGDLALAGTLQAALNEVSKKPATNPFAAMEALSTKALAAPERAADAEYKFPAAAAGYSAYGLSGWTRQADILRPLAPILSARDETFTIRGYGDARDASGKGLAHAVCEAVVRRTREFADASEAADILTPPTHAANKTFGRRIELISLRWLAANEV